jgi:hypothetical protein
MKKQGFIKNNVMAWLVMASFDKAIQIPRIDMISPIFEGDDANDVWQVRS